MVLVQRITTYAKFKILGPLIYSLTFFTLRYIIIVRLDVKILNNHLKCQLFYRFKTVSFIKFAVVIVIFVHTLVSTIQNNCLACLSQWLCCCIQQLNSHATIHFRRERSVHSSRLLIPLQKKNNNNSETLR